MQIREMRALRGPNVWSRAPVIEAWCERGAAQPAPRPIEAAFRERLLGWLPGLKAHRCERPGTPPFAERLAGSRCTPEDILEHVAAELQLQSGGSPEACGNLCVGAGASDQPAVIAVREEAVGRACLEAAARLCRAARDGQPFDVEAEIARLHAVAEDACFGPNSSALLRAARERDIPFRRLGPGSLVLLGQGARQHRIRTTETDQTRAIAKFISMDKALAKRLLQAAGLPVAAGRAVASPEEAWEAALELGMPVVVKPIDGDRGRGVSIGLSSRDAVLAGYELARQVGTPVLVERFAAGAEHRLLVVAGAVVAAARGDAAYVLGDGRATIAELIERQLNSDPRRGRDLAAPLTRIELDGITRLTLDQSGYQPGSVPPAGEKVLVRRNGNHAADITDEVHPAVAELAVEAAQVIGLDVAGVDVVAEDIRRPLEEQGGIIVEVNEGPGMDMHLKPASGRARPVGQAVLGSMFPPGDDGRIPIFAITGERPRTEAAVLAARWLGRTGRVVGLACGQGLYVGGRCLRDGDQANAQAALDLLFHPRVEIAVIEVSPGSLREEGLGFDRCRAALRFGSALREPEIRRAEDSVAALLAPAGDVTSVCLAGSPPESVAAGRWDSLTRQAAATAECAGWPAAAIRALLVSCSAMGLSVDDLEAALREHSSW
jgi:cyanophycin synthetase